MKRFILIGLLAVSGCANLDQGDLNDIYPGKWCEMDNVTNTCLGYMSVYKNGTYEASGEIVEYDAEYRTSGTWRIIDGKICITRLFSEAETISTGSPLEPMPIGESYCDRVKKYSRLEIIYEDNEGAEWAMKKVSGA